jgi:hypothetical protein
MNGDTSENWHIATFCFSAKIGRYRGKADIKKISRRPCFLSACPGARQNSDCLTSSYPTVRLGAVWARSAERCLRPNGAGDAIERQQNHHRRDADRQRARSLLSGL